MLGGGMQHAQRTAETARIAIRLGQHRKKSRRKGGCNPDMSKRSRHHVHVTPIKANVIRFPSAGKRFNGA
ncbi:MAG: hypothetical protein ACREKL_02830 [Chthoniobacterales bacterium]